MSRKWRIPPVHRSLVGQTTLLSLALLLLALGYFVFLPFLTMDLPDPKQRTMSFVTFGVFDLLRDPEKPLSAVEDREEIREAAAVNARFRLYIRRGSEEVQIGGPPRWEGALDYSELWSTQEMSAIDGNGPAGPYVSFSFSEENALGISSYRLSQGQETYYEIGGIEVPIQRATERPAFWDPEVFWNWTQDYLAVGGAVFAGVLFLLFLLVRSMRRLANVAQSLDPQAPSHRLPEKGLPTEIVPMVRAINRMIRRIDRANEEQAFFLAAAAHELRTPLAIVRTRLENLPEGEDKEELKNDLRRMSRLVDQLLRLMSVRNKGKPSDTVDLVSIAKNVVAERAPLVIDKGVEIDLDADGQPVEVSGDERLLKVALANLVDNALSFSDPGQRLMVQVSPDKNITVRDEGPGIPHEEMDNIFQPFAKNPPNRRGHGLGLAITRSIMALHGGSVNAANHKRGGASFALQF